MARCRASENEHHRLFLHPQFHNSTSEGKVQFLQILHFKLSRRTNTTDPIDSYAAAEISTENVFANLEETTLLAKVYKNHFPAMNSTLQLSLQLSAKTLFRSKTTLHLHPKSRSTFSFFSSSSLFSGKSSKSQAQD